jgi:beta-glucosidase
VWLGYLCPMKLEFPAGFKFGTSTAAYQIETAVQHDWVDVKARDGHVFNRTTDHEKRINEDVEIIASIAPHYRMSLMWSKLQKGPLENFDPAACAFYHTLLTALSNKKIKIMMVLHHFANPTWFAASGGWEKESNISLWVDFCKKLIVEFGDYVDSWNTFNEPNLCTSMGWITGEFPPFKKNNFLMARSALKNMACAHSEVYALIKHHNSKASVGISHNCTVFAPDNFLGVLPAKFMDYNYMEYPPSLFKEIDFFGMSYYARIGFDPLPSTFITTPEKIKQKGKLHDDMWEYYPQGILECMRRYWTQYKKPIIITENGICTQDDSKRMGAIKDYLTLIHQGISEGIDVHGYYHWTTWDNFEWSLGPTYNFGLYSVDMNTKDRTKKPSADLYSSIAYSNTIEL